MPLPAPRGAAAAEAPASAAETASATTAAPSSTAAEERSGAVIAPTPACAPQPAAAATAQQRKEKKCQHEKRQNKTNGKAAAGGGLAPLRFGQRLALRDFHHRGDPGFYAAGEIAVFETRRDLLVDNAIGDRVRQHASESVADFDAQLAVFRRDDEDRAVIEAFFTDLPLLGDFDAEVLDRLAFKTRDGEHDDLMTGRVLELLEALIERTRTVARHEAGVVVDAPLERRRVEGCEGCDKKNDDQEGEERRCFTLKPNSAVVAPQHGGEPRTLP